MQPCAVCGAQAVDQAGYCAQCGTYRGVEPVSAPLPGHRNPFVVPLIVLSAVLVLLVGAIVAVAVARSGGGRTTGGPGSPTPAASNLVDPCIVGTWRVISHEERVDLPPVGEVEFTGKEPGARVTLRPDGTGATDFGAGTEFEASKDGRTFALTFAGSVNYDFRTSDGQVTFTNIRPNGTVKLVVDGKEATSAPLTGNLDSVRYTCAGDTLRELTSKYETQLRRAQA
jgi:hypothetical protein